MVSNLTGLGKVPLSILSLFTMNPLISPTVKKSAKASISHTYLARTPMTTLQKMLQEAFCYPSTSTPLPMGKPKLWAAGRWWCGIHLPKGVGGWTEIQGYLHCT